MDTTYIVSLLSDGLIFSLISIGVYIAFVWLRFPDLTPDASIVSGGIAYLVAAKNGTPLIVSLLICSSIGGMLAGVSTAVVHRFLKIPAVIASLLVASAFYSVHLLILDKPNYPIEPYSLTGGLSLDEGGVLSICFWLLPSCILVIFILSLFAETRIGLSIRAVGENPRLANELKTSLTRCTIISLIIANGIVGLAGAFLAELTSAVDVNSGFGVTLAGLSGVVLGLFFARRTRRIWIVLLCITVGALVCRSVISLALLIGIPAQVFRLGISVLLALVFVMTYLIRHSEVLRGIRWN